MTDLSNCPAKEGLLPNSAAGCHCFFVNEKKGVIINNKSTPYNSTYFASDKDNCCTGYTNAKPTFPKGYPSNQRGRWNYDTTNTKMYPHNGLIVKNRIPDCEAPCYPDNYNVVGTKRSGNIFPNTYKMSKRQLYAFLAKNRMNR